MHFTEAEKALIHSLLVKGRAVQTQQPGFAIIDFDAFFALFTDAEVAILQKYLATDVAALNYKLPHLGVEPIPTDLVPIAGQRYVVDGQHHLITCQYLPQEAYAAYKQMNQTMHDEIGKQLLVLYGYRSPARQVFMFFDILERKYDYDFEKTLKRVCFPAYSEHVCSRRQAVDYMTVDGIKGEGFETTQEYRWLQDHAHSFHFFESYPKDNRLDMMYEPWHWHYEKV